MSEQIFQDGQARSFNRTTPWEHIAGMFVASNYGDIDKFYKLIGAATDCFRAFLHTAEISKVFTEYI